MEKKTAKKDFSKMTYQQLEEEGESVLSQLQKGDLPLDESKRLYDYGKLLYKEMENRLETLIKETKDDIQED